VLPDINASDFFASIFLLKKLKKQGKELEKNDKQ